ncbi:MAG: poly-gamma-glutamate system protein [Nitrospiraceae bacterium]|nr:MAG: poly-gamma-glutamate system protein [Nitrospiraceae bacterium]
MKKVYWRPQSLPLSANVFIACFALVGLIAAETLQITVRQPYYAEKLAAARLASEAMEAIRFERLGRGLNIDPETDPAQSGLIGALVTPVTSDVGDLQAKQTTINPNFAAVVVDLLMKSGVKEGDKVAVGFSGSFPALNISVCAALATLKLRPTIISGASGSQWGANDPDFLWIDMEYLLYKKGLFPFRSVASSIGGRSDRGKEMTEKGRELVLQAVKRNGLGMIEAKTIRENIDARMSVYLKDRSPVVFINVGGGVASAGTRPYKIFLKPGVISQEQSLPKDMDSVILRFLREEVPVIHLGNIGRLAGLYGLPVAPSDMPEAGEGSIYLKREYNRWLAAGILIGISFCLYFFVRSDRGFRMMHTVSREEDQGPPELMI